MTGIHVTIFFYPCLYSYEIWASLYVIWPFQISDLKLTPPPPHCVEGVITCIIFSSYHLFRRQE